MIRTDDGAACVIVASTEWVRRHQPDRRLVRPIASALQSEAYSPGHTFLGPVVGPATMTATTARLAYEDAGLVPEDMHLALCHDAFANEELDKALEQAQKKEDEKSELENGFEMLGSDAELDQVIFDGSSFGTATEAGRCPLTPLTQALGGLSASVSKTPSSSLRTVARS